MLTPDPHTRTLLEPVLPVLQSTLERASWKAPLRVSTAELKSWWDLSEGSLLLSSRLEDPSFQLEGEPPLEQGGLDRWRRMSASVLEGAAALGALGLSTSPEALPSWTWRGAAALLADEIAPELGIRSAAARRLEQSGSLLSAPEAGLFLLEEFSAPPQELLSAWTRAGGLPWEEVSPALQRLLARRPCPFSLSALPEKAFRDPLSPWSLAWVGPASCAGSVLAEGEIAHESSWLERGKRLLTGVGSGGELRLEPGGPLGRWEMSSGHGFGQFFGVRGVDCVLTSKGGCEFILANAFAGPMGAEGLGQRVGSSGIIQGSWSMPSPSELRFGRLRSRGVTVHGSVGGRFAMPAGGAGLESYLQNLSETQWNWQVDGTELTLRGELMGQPFELKLQSAAP